MKNVETVSGRIGLVSRLESSKNGNPRYMVSISNDRPGSENRIIMARTTPDSSLAYSIGNKGLREGDMVNARIGWHYGVLSIESMEPATDKGANNGARD